MNANRIMVIAGSDSSGGAGLSRDIAVAAELGVEVMPIVTAVTAQTHEAVAGTVPIPARFVRQQIEAARTSGEFQAIKIGMLGTVEVAECVADCLQHMPVPTVFDPVLKASSGGALMAGQVPRALLAQADLVTPNLEEAAVLTGRALAADFSTIAAQANGILQAGAGAVLVKGGHGGGEEATDHLFGACGHHAFPSPRLPVERRGTGCAFATTIACQLALGRGLVDACRLGKQRMQSWLEQSLDA